ncbi:hypothetical protein TKK_0015326 [Trichogramma kaykai]
MSSSEDSSEVDDGPLKFASVKFIHSKEVDTIPIEDIDEFDELSWPDHEQEFDKTKIYTCTYQPKGSQVKQKFGIQISHFKCAKHIEGESRGKFSKLDRSTIDEYTLKCTNPSAKPSTKPSAKPLKKSSVKPSKKSSTKSDNSKKRPSEENMKEYRRKKKHETIEKNQQVKADQLVIIQRKNNLLNTNNLKLGRKNPLPGSGSNEGNISNSSKKRLSKSTTRSPIINSTNVDNRSCKNINVTEKYKGNCISTALQNRGDFDDIETISHHSSIVASPSEQSDVPESTKNLNNNKMDNTPTNSTPKKAKNSAESTEKMKETSNHSPDKYSSTTPTEDTPKNKKSARTSETVKENLLEKFSSSRILIQSPLSRTTIDQLEPLISRNHVLQSENEELRKANENLMKAVNEGKVLYQKALEKINSYMTLYRSMKDFVKMMSNDDSSDMRIAKFSENCFEEKEQESSISDTSKYNRCYKRRADRDSGISDSQSSGRNKPKKAKKTMSAKLHYLPDIDSDKPFRHKFVDEISGEKMIYLRHGYSLDLSTWTELLSDSKTKSIFCKGIFRHFYKDKAALRICIKQSKNSALMTPNGEHEREIIPEKFVDMTKKCLEYYVLDRLEKGDEISTEKMVSFLKNVTHYFSEEISAVKKKS